MFQTTTSVQPIPVEPAIRAHARIQLARLLIPGLLALAIFTSTPWPRNSISGLVLEVLAVVLLIAAIVIRVWSALFISGRKSATLITEGPYSMVRNPLYCGSFCGAVAVCLATQNLLVVLVTLPLFLMGCDLVVRKEEAVLEAIHGEEFRRYKARVPRYIPNMSLYREPHECSIEPRRIRKAILDATGFVAAFVLAQTIAFLVTGEFVRAMVS